MREVGRRGSTNLMYEVVISLILLGLFAATAYYYVDSHATGEAYYSQFHAADLSTSADLVLAGNGDVLLRYDNLKRSLDLTFWLTNGEVAIAPTPLPETTVSLGKTTTTLDLTKPLVATSGYYGRARDYPRPETIFNPLYLALRKVDGSFSITEADVALETCPSDPPSVTLADALVRFTVEGLTTEETRRAEQAFADTLPKGVRTTTGDDATVIIDVRRATGADALALSGSADGARYACLFARHLSLLSLREWQTPTGGTGTGFTATLTLTTGADTLVKPEHVGQAAALALARMYATGGGGDD